MVRHVPENAMPKSEHHLYLLLAGLGVAVWLLPWLLLGRKEAWDHWSYFLVSLPLMAFLAAYAGYRAKSRAWRWPLTLVCAQFFTALLLGGFGNLFPLGIAVLVVFALPMMITASVGAWFARRREEHAS
jgi:cytochrome bd-type quinol oxidase subunit 2